MSVAIRPVGASEICALAVFQTACWQEAYRGLLPDAFLRAMDPAARAAAWQQRLLSGEREIAAAWHEGEIVGAVSWTPGAVDELNTLYVKADQRGTGLAARLLGVSIAGRPAGVWVFDGNTRAQRFYEKHGFQLTGEQAIDAETEMPERRLRRL